MFFISFLILASAIQYSEITTDIFSGGHVFAGFMMGASLVFYNKGCAIQGVRLVMEETVLSIKYLVKS